MTQAIPETPLNGAADVELPAEHGADVVPIEPARDARVLARDAVRSALAASKIALDSHLDVVRFQCGDLPVWALRGALEEERAAAKSAAPQDSETWDTGGDRAAPPDVLAAWDAAPDDKPTIRIRAGEIERQFAETVAAISTDRNLFQRTDALVTIVREPRRTEGGRICEERASLSGECSGCHAKANDPCERAIRKGRDIIMRPGTPRIRIIGAPGLTLRAARAATFLRWVEPRGKGEGQWSAANPCKETMAIVHRPDDGWPGVRPLRGILETPSISPSFRIIDAPGYDDETGYVLLPSCDVGPIDLHPTQKHARAALRYLWIEMACDFPFQGMDEPDPVTDPERALQYAKALECPDAFVGIAMLLSIFARLAIEGPVPGGVFEAAAQGSGKSLQMHTVAMIATSRAASVATFPMRDGRPNEEELEKVLAGYALAGARLVAFDNIRGILGGAALEKVLAAFETICLRVLGSNDQRDLPWAAVPMFSGNNMAMSDDMAQRVLVARVESPREDPRSRLASSFRHPRLLAALRDRRPKLVRACLVILRAYFSARARGETMIDCGTLGTFEAWADIVPPAIAWAGGPNVLRARPEMGSGGDDEGAAHVALMRGWRDEWQDQRASFVLADAMKHEEEERRDRKHGIDTAPDGLDEVRAAIRSFTHTADGREPNAITFGKKLKDIQGKWRDGMRIVGRVDKHTKIKLWRVERKP